MINPSTLTQEIDKKLYLALKKHLVEALSINTPFKTGHTAGSWDVRRGNNEFEYILVNKNGLIAQYLNEGTKAHDITPNTKKMLRFEMKRPPVFKKPKDKTHFQKTGKIFFFNRGGVCVLGFVREGNKTYCFAKKVKHPGIEGRHFIEKTLLNDALWKRISDDVI